MLENHNLRQFHLLSLNVHNVFKGIVLDSQQLTDKLVEQPGGLLGMLQCLWVPQKLISDRIHSCRPIYKVGSIQRGMCTLVFPVGFATHPGVTMSTCFSKSNATISDLHAVIGLV